MIMSPSTIFPDYNLMMPEHVCVPIDDYTLIISIKQLNL